MVPVPNLTKNEAMVMNPHFLLRDNLSTFGNPFINDLLVKPPDPADPDRGDLFLFA